MTIHSDVWVDLTADLNWVRMYINPSDHLFRCPNGSCSWWLRMLTNGCLYSQLFAAVSHSYKHILLFQWNSYFILGGKIFLQLNEPIMAVWVKHRKIAKLPWGLFLLTRVNNCQQMKWNKMEWRGMSWNEMGWIEMGVLFYFLPFPHVLVMNVVFDFSEKLIICFVKKISAMLFWMLCML